MELRHLLYFKAVAELLHFSKAAVQLHISQPPLTRQIKELEKELGVLLFRRNNKRVELTEAGAYFLKECDTLIRQLERSKQLVKQIHESTSGEFKIGYISSTPKTALANVLKALRQRYPLLKTRLYEVSTSKQIKALEEGKLDVGIIRAPIHSVQLHIESLDLDKFALVCPVNMPYEVNAAWLKEQTFISYNSNYAPDYHNKLLDCCNRLGFYPEIMHECNNMHSILCMVENELGIALVPVSVKDQYPYLKLVFTEFSNIHVSTEIVLAHHQHTIHPALNYFKRMYNSFYNKNVDRLV